MARTRLASFQPPQPPLPSRSLGGTLRARQGSGWCVAARDRRDSLLKHQEFVHLLCTLLKLLFSGKRDK